LPSIIFFNQHYKAINKTDNSEKETETNLFSTHDKCLFVCGDLFD